MGAGDSSIMRCTVAVMLAAGLLPAAPAVDFAREVQPILHSRCAGCHSGDKPQAGFSVLTRTALSRALNPGSSGDSLLIRRVTTPESRMPLGQKPLDDGE